MPGSCPFVNARGETCGKGFAAGFGHCAHHRARPAPKPSRPCSSCGKPTKRDCGLCLGRYCGWNQYRRELAARKKAAAEEARNQDACARVLDEYVADLVESFDAASCRPAPPPPPAAWKALSDDARSELMYWIRQAIEADRRDADAAAAHRTLDVPSVHHRRPRALTDTPCHV